MDSLAWTGFWGMYVVIGVRPGSELMGYTNVERLGPQILTKGESFRVVFLPSWISANFFGCLSKGTLSEKTGTVLPTVTDSLFAAGIIPSHSIGIALAPVSNQLTSNGRITWGMLEHSLT